MEGEELRQYLRNLSKRRLEEKKGNFIQAGGTANVDYQENTYLVVKDGKCLIIDPGNYYDEENSTIKKFIDDNSLIPEFILITHVHIDHVLGIKYLADEYSIDTFIPGSN